MDDFPQNNTKPDEGVVETSFIKTHSVQIVVLVLASLIGGVIFWVNRDDSGSSVSTEPPVPLSIDKIKGTTIYLSLRQSDTEELTKIRSFDVGENKTSLLTQSGAWSAYPYFSRDRSRVIFSRVPKGTSYEDRNITQLHSADTRTLEVKQLTTSKTYLKGHPQWSPDETKIAFIAQPEYVANKGEAPRPEVYSIYILDEGGREILLTEGAYPKWTPNGDIVFLKTDGVYLYSFNNGKQENIWPITGGVANTAMTINISRDGKHIVWSTPFVKRTAVMRVGSWAPFKGTVVGEIGNSRLYWPVFSEDGRYVVFQNPEGDIKDQLSPHKLVVYSLETLQSKVIFDLEGYDLTHTSITDWRENP